jgi:glycosyltransferase involved in cell wall biosynthesis
MRARRVMIVTSARNPVATGLENAEARLLAAVTEGGDDGVDVEVRVAGGRGARRTARRLGARWVPARPDTSTWRAWRRADVVHLAGLAVPPPTSVPFLATFHDLAALVYPDEGKLPESAHDIAERAAAIVCPSRFTAGELERRLGVDAGRIHVIPNGPGQDVSPATAPLDMAARAELGLPERFVLRLGGYTARKNVGRLLDAWPHVSQALGLKLVLAGPPHRARDALLAAAPSLDDVVILDYLPAAVVPRLIRSAAAVVSTSLYEGFGMTPLEAMAAGVPAVVVRTEAAEEVCGDAATLVEDSSLPLAAALEHAVADDERRHALIERGLARAREFTWERAAADLRTVYRQLPLG